MLLEAQFILHFNFFIEQVLVLNQIFNMEITFMCICKCKKVTTNVTKQMLLQFY
jgi:hypothetical protein